MKVGRFVTGAATHRLFSFAVKGSRKTNGHLGGLVGRCVRGFVFNVSRLEVIIEEKNANETVLE